MLRSDIRGLLPYVGGGILLILLGRAFFSFEGAGPVETGDSRPYLLKVAGQEITAELARTPWEHQLGLKHRHWLPENHGMLFVFQEEDHLTFWMKDTYVPLSIAFISRHGIITQIESMQPLSLQGHDSVEEVMYALEMKEGWFERHNVKVGDRVELLPVATRN
jgi:uncharacterized membrane protein (UPF0127 family)